MGDVPGEESELVEFPLYRGWTIMKKYDVKGVRFIVRFIDTHG